MDIFSTAGLKWLKNVKKTQITTSKQINTKAIYKSLAGLIADIYLSPAYHGPGSRPMDLGQYRDRLSQ